MGSYIWIILLMRIILYCKCHYTTSLESIAIDVITSKSVLHCMLVTTVSEMIIDGITCILGYGQFQV